MKYLIRLYLNAPVIAVLALLVLTNIVTLGLWWRASADRQDPAQQYPFIDVARNYIPQEHFIVNVQPLRDALQKVVADNGADSISIYFEFLNSGANIQINNDTRFYPASLVKLPAAMAVMKKIESGAWHIDDRLVLMDQDRDDRFGTLYQQPVGTSFSIDDLLKDELILSDDTAHNIIMRNLSSSELDDLRDAIGLQDLFNEQGQVSAKEYTRLWRALYESSYLTRASSQQLLQWLAETSFNSLLASGLPKGATFAHKIGEDDEQQNYLDSGIVYLPNRPYMLTVMIKQHDQEAAGAIMKQISSAAYNYVEHYGQKS